MQGFVWVGGKGGAEYLKLYTFVLALWHLKTRWLVVNGLTPGWCALLTCDAGSMYVYIHT